MAHTPLKMSIEDAHAEMNYAWKNSYSSEAIAKAVDSISHKPLSHRTGIFLARLFFRGIYFPQSSPWAWVKVIAQNRRTIFKLLAEGFGIGRKKRKETNQASDTEIIT
jgi:uncharacterized Fe-S cluster-containing MiaB family protein